MIYFRTTTAIYTQIQTAIDEAFRADWIETGKCEHIFPPELPVRSDGFCYLAAPEWIIEVAGADIFRGWPGVVAITGQEYQSATVEGVNT